jgi:hypothetical protein
MRALDQLFERRSIFLLSLTRRGPCFHLFPASDGRVRRQGEGHYLVTLISRGLISTSAAAVRRSDVWLLFLSLRDALKRAACTTGHETSITPLKFIAGMSFSE